MMDYSINTFISNNSTFIKFDDLVIGKRFNKQLWSIVLEKISFETEFKLVRFIKIDKDKRDY